MAQYHSINYFEHNTGILQLRSAYPIHSTFDHRNQDQLPEFCTGYNKTINGKFLVQGNYKLTQWPPVQNTYWKQCTVGRSRHLLCIYLHDLYQHVVWYFWYNSLPNSLHHSACRRLNKCYLTMAEMLLDLVKISWKWIEIYWKCINSPILSYKMNWAKFPEDWHISANSLLEGTPLLHSLAFTICIPCHVHCKFYQIFYYIQVPNVHTPW